MPSLHTVHIKVKNFETILYTTRVHSFIIVPVLILGLKSDVSDSYK